MTRTAGVTTRAPWLLLALCLVLGASFRFYHLDRQSFWYDEMFTRFWATGQSWRDVREKVPTVELTAAELQRVLAMPPERGLRDVIRAIRRDDPQHTPFYYFLAHGWIRVFGDSAWTLRALSVLIGLLTLPCIYWLCRELALGVRTSQVATALASVSPFFVIYSQEARQYGLYGVEVLIASALLLRAMRIGRARDWMLYGTALVAGLYTHLLFATVIAAHALFVMASLSKRKAPISDISNGYPISKFSSARSRVLPFVVIVAFAGLALLPWLSSLLANSARATSHLGWSTERVGLPHLFGMWAFNYSSLFVDADHSQRLVERPDVALVIDYGFRCVALALAGLALWFVMRRVADQARWFILALIFAPFLSLAIPDVVLGGIRSGGGHRYLFPSYIGVVLAVSCLLGGEGELGVRFARARVVAFCGIVACAVASLMVHANARTWWTKPVGYQLPRIAQIVSQSPNPLVIAPVSVNLITMSTLLAPTSHVLPVRGATSFDIPGGYATIFVLEPSNAMLEKWRSADGLTLFERDSRGKLWELRRRKPE